ncbi:MAG: hypothetical protein ACO1SV_00405 [Fimbriimonas sp.]
MRQPLHGKAEVLRFVEKGLRVFWGPSAWAPADINGGRGILVREDGKVTSAVTFAYDATGALKHIYIVRNPDKLARLANAEPIFE